MPEGGLTPGSMQRWAVPAVLVAAALFGTTGTVLVNAPAGADAYSVAALRLLVGGAALTAVGRPWRAEARLVRAPLLVGAVAVAVFQLGTFLAVTRTGVAVATLTSISSGPVWSGGIDAMLHRRAPSPRWLAGTAVSILGVALLTQTATTGAVDIVGIVLALVGGLAWAVYATAGKRVIDRGGSSTAAMAVLFGGGALIVAPLLAWHSPRWAWSGTGVLTVAYLGLATVFLAYWLYGRALRSLAAPTVITLTLMEPITAALLGAVVVHERITPIGWAGVVLVLCGLVITATGATLTTPG